MAKVKLLRMTVDMCKRKMVKANFGICATCKYAKDFKDNHVLCKGDEEDEQTEEAHRVIAEAQEAAEIVYFIEGMEIK